MKRVGLVVAVVVAVSCGAYARFFGYLPNHVDDLAFASLEPFHAQGERDNLHLRFRSNANLRHLAEHSGAFGAYANISLCPFHENPWVSIGRVRHNDIDLDTKPTQVCISEKGADLGCRMHDDTPAVRQEVANAGDTEGPFVYDVYFSYSEQWLTYTNLGTTERRIPLPATPQDLCVRIDGDGGPPGLRSNVFVIPRAALVRALGTTRIPPLGPTAWVRDIHRLDCEPQAFAPGQRVVLSLGPNHGAELAIRRLADGAWFLLVGDSPPADMQPAMTPRALAEATRLDLTDGIAGYRWWSSEGGQTRIFTVTGDYLIYLSDNIEGDEPGLGCLLRFTRDRLR